MGCWEFSLRLNVRLHAHGFTSQDYIFRVHKINECFFSMSYVHATILVIMNTYLSTFL